MFIPQNEQGVVALFATMAKDAGWEFVSIGAAFPDAVLVRGGEEWRVEFEFVASNFLDHKHDHRACDLIICWQNDYSDCPLPVIEISNNEWVDQEIKRCGLLEKEVEYWKRRCLRAERQGSIMQSYPVPSLSPDSQRDDSLPSDIERQVSVLLSQGIEARVIATHISPHISGIEMGRVLGVNASTISRWRKAAQSNGHAMEVAQ